MKVGNTEKWWNVFLTWKNDGMSEELENKNKILNVKKHA